ncbi:DUF2304 domain-containing protein [uncultured Nocardioides sp.]|uniref:DUF2304 domain-containing protein n=1 Tax=uncultured Nocardioides sp. TaxID=198441 RepID=UPI001AC52023|nr:DUF2304 domain-containing protein [uncultured Nocardioides sp.]GIM64369.1 hypothetical protein Pve01_94760 [Planomonospora venezuelensis]
MSGVSILGIVGSLVILLSLFEMLRRHRLREKYALIWGIVALGALTVAAFPSLLAWATTAIGLQVPANLLFFVASLVIMVLTLQHSSELGRLEERTRTLAEDVALLQVELERRPLLEKESGEESA